jgi:succinate dehydrogenase/fumarate reductase flavoprotein subunit
VKPAALALALAACRPPPGGAGPGAPARPGPDTAPPADSGPAPDTADTADTAAPPGPTADVWIIGAGPAGLTAAADAHAAGLRVGVLERWDAPGGSSHPGSQILFAGTSTQAAAGIADSPAALLAHWPALTDGGDAASPWVQRFAAEATPRVHDWLLTLGLRFRSPPSADALDPSPRLHRLESTGPTLPERLLALLPADTVHTGWTVTALHAEAGRVAGAWAVPTATPGAAPTLFAAPAVVLATGGFARDLPRVLAARPDLPAGPLLFGNPRNADGSGHALAEALGAAFANPGAIGLYAHGVPAAAGSREERTSPQLGALPWVNAEGQRFVDETEHNSLRVGALRAAQPGGGAVWLVADADTAPTLRFTAPGDPTAPALDADALLAAGVGHRADTLPALAAAAGLPADALDATLRTWNASAGGATDPFRPPGSPGAPVRTPPFTALPLGITLSKSFGGLAVDPDGRVLGPAGAPIPGLYAAGELTGMAGGTLVGARGFNGSLSAGLLSARVAAATLAADRAADRAAAE